MKNKTLALILLFNLYNNPYNEVVASEYNDIRDFMIQDVCIDLSGNIDIAAAPGFPGCRSHRNIKPDDILNYHMHDHPSENNKQCKYRLGTLSKENIPVIRNGVERIVSFYDKGTDQSCPYISAKDPKFGVFDGPEKEGGSVQWYDDEYGFIMGSWSTQSLSYWRTPLCELSPQTSKRFMRGWIIGPRKLPAEGDLPGYGVFRSKIESGDPGKGPIGCPTNYTSAFTLWIRSRYNYKSQINLSSLISEHYSRSNVNNTSPGDSQQFERTYWTAEYGLTRWEKWARDDWRHPRNGKSVLELATSQMSSNACNSGYVFPNFITKDYYSEPKLKDGLHVELRYDKNTNEQHYWYMTLCKDYTNIVFDSNPRQVPKWSNGIPNSYWEE